ncbi:MAG: hypothetical protein U1D29_11585 [Burkholderiales bacterium]|nr:hypothetical protein [Burkholderiales bacterium]
MIALCTSALHSLLCLLGLAQPRHQCSLEDLKTIFINPVRNAQDHRSRAFRFSVEAAQSADDLWHLRSRAYLRVSEHAGQAEAQRFLRKVDAALADWLPPARFSRPALAG